MNDCEHDHEAGGNCQQLLSSLSEYIDGELSEELCKELEQHMQDCQRCRIVVDTMRKTVELYQEVEEDENGIPAEVRERLYRRLNLEDFQKEIPAK